MTELDLEPIKARCYRASGAPWYASRWGVQSSEFDEFVVLTTGREPREVPNEADREFVAHARLDVPDLVLEVERLRAECERLRSGG